MDQKKIDRINELSRISRERELTEEEQTERKALRLEYIESYSWWSFRFVFYDGFCQLYN